MATPSQGYTAITRLLWRGRSPVGRESRAGQGSSAYRSGSRRSLLRRDPSPFTRDSGASFRPLVLVNLLGLVALVAGLTYVAATTDLFSAGAALDGVLSQLGTTLGPAVSVGLGTAVDLAAGAVLMRMIRWSPYGSFAEAAIWGLVGAIAKDTFLLYGLGSVGHFGPLPLALVDIGLLGTGLLLRPFVATPTDEQGRSSRSWSPAAWSLPLVLWSIPLVLQLASPVVPFMDVLPDHVAPIEHLRTYATQPGLGVSPSPVYSPSQVSLGYLGLVGSITTLTGLPAALAVAAFALPLSVLLAAAGYHVSRTLAGTSAAYWSLLTVPLTFAFLRLPDARASVLALPVAAAVICLTLPARTDRQGTSQLSGRSRPVLMAAAAGATLLAHPIIGLFTLLTVLLLALIRAGSLRRSVLAGLIGGAMIALPQAAVAAGIAAPSWIALPAWPLGLVLAAGLAGTGPRRGELTEPLAPARSMGTIGLVLGLIVLLAVGALVTAGGTMLVQLDPQMPVRVGEAAARLAAMYPVLLLGLAISLVMLRSLSAWLVVGAALMVGLAGSTAAAAITTVSLPGLALAETAEAAAFGLSDAAAYWAPWFMALGAGMGLGSSWARDAWPAAVRVGVTGAFVVLAALPFRLPDTDAPRPEEHRYAESAAVALHHAQGGYWQRFDDPRRLLGVRGMAIVAALREEQAAGRIGPDARLLHVAPSFQAWVATPVGVFTGILETVASEDPEDSLHTAGGRLIDVAEVSRRLGPAFPYLLIEGYTPEAGFTARAQAADYEPVASGNGWSLLRLQSD